MNKRILTALTAVALATALAACGDNTSSDIPPETDLPSALSTTTEPTVTTTEPTETTPPETAAPSPLPEVKEGTVYTKKAIDAYGGGLDFVHSLLIPRIDSEKPGAAALNAKMLADQQDKLDALAANKEEQNLYTVTYSTSGADGILAINVYEYTGWQYSEGGSTRCFYYYDVSADRELTLDEVLARLSLTADALDKAFAWSSEYAAVSIETTHTENLAASVFGTFLADAADNAKFYYAESVGGAETELLGLDFDETTVTPWYGYAVYVVGTVSCPISRENGQPLDPYYVCKLDADDLTAGDTFRITCKDGAVTEATVPADAAVKGITITPNSIKILYERDTAFDFDSADFRVNGTSIHSGSNGGLTDTNGLFYLSLYLPSYLSLGTEETIELVPEGN